MIRSYFVLIGFVCLSLAVVGCSDDGGGGGGGGGDGGTGGSAGTDGGGGTGGGGDFGPQTKAVSLGCTNTVTTDVSILEWDLTVDPEPIMSGEEFTAKLSGAAQFDETFLDAAQNVVMGGVRKAELVALAATVLVRSGATGPAVTLGISPPYVCNQFTECDLEAFPECTDCLATPEQCVPAACDPANDVPEGQPGAGGNTDCLFNFGNPSIGDNCGQFVELPVSEDCEEGGLCESLEDNFVEGNKRETQCPNGFCVTGSLPFPLDEEVGTYTADSSAEVLFGWVDENTGAEICTDTTAPDGFPDNACDGGAGTYALLKPAFADPAEPNGLRVIAALNVGVQCTMAVEAGVDTSEPPDGEPDQSAPTPNEDLISFPIQGGGTGGVGGGGGEGGEGGGGGSAGGAG
jgi:hypothetical protein